jgi:Peptidase A4 family
MIGTGFRRARLARWPIYPIAAAGLVVGQVFLVAPAMAAQGANPDARVGTWVTANCGGCVSAINVRLPAGFNALTATRAELIANNLPVRPAGAVQLAAWRKFVTEGVKAAPSRCAAIRVLSGSTRSAAPSMPGNNRIGDRASATPQNIVGDVRPFRNMNIVGDVRIIGEASVVRTQNIVGDISVASASGTAVTGSTRLSIVGDATTGGSTAGSVTGPGTKTGKAFNDVFGTWRVPAAGKRATAGPNGLAPAGIDLGLGTSARQPIVQAGSAARRPAVGKVAYYLWWRAVPQQVDQRQIAIRVAAGDSVYAHIRISRGQALVTIRDESTGAGGTYLLRLSQLG